MSAALLDVAYEALHHWIMWIVVLCVHIFALSAMAIFTILYGRNRALHKVGYMLQGFLKHATGEGSRNRNEGSANSHAREAQ